jgi:acyl-CoA hydrolase
MEAGVRIESEDPMSGERRHACSAFLTFVAQDQHGRSVEVPPLTLEDEEDKRRAADARARRAIRLAHRQARRERLLAEKKP